MKPAEKYLEDHNLWKICGPGGDFDREDMIKFATDFAEQENNTLIKEVCRWRAAQNMKLSGKKGTTPFDDLVKENKELMDRMIKYAKHQHFRGEINRPFVEFDDWKND